MRKTNIKLLKALVVGYKNGLINRRPLRKWVDNDAIFNKLIKMLIYIVISLFLITIIKDNSLQIINQKLIVNGFILDKYRIITGFIYLFLTLVVCHTVKYIYQVVTVKTYMKNYSFEQEDIQKLDQITFKINV